MKYYVVVSRYDSESKGTAKFAAGEFSRFVDAELFARAYEAAYASKAEILDEFELFVCNF